MPYEVNIDGTWYSEDVLGVEEIEAVEKACETPWSIINPYRSIKEYQAMVGAFLVRAGKTDEEAIAWFRARNVKELREALRIAGEGEDDRPKEYKGDLPDPKAAD